MRRVVHVLHAETVATVEATAVTAEVAVATAEAVATTVRASNFSEYDRAGESQDSPAFFVVRPGRLAGTD